MILSSPVLAASPADSAPPPPPGDRVADARAGALMDNLRKLHKGPGPCYRWDRRSTVSEESVKQAAMHLHAKGIKSDELAQVVPLFVKWAEELEAKVHEQSERDELKKTVRESAPAPERAKIDANPKALDALADQIVSKPIDTRKAQSSFEKLQKAKQAILSQSFKANTPALRLSFVDVVVELKGLESPAAKGEGALDDHGHDH